ncbi:hypothetical protein [Arthrobacter sp. RAF14]|uniref:hypothetical protein n=1 Tax=Arthrobacter sp. RAF14 TaxID=3233051 RepID=UPI003F915A41
MLVFGCCVELTTQSRKGWVVFRFLGDGYVVLLDPVEESSDGCLEGAGYRGVIVSIGTAEPEFAEEGIDDESPRSVARIAVVPLRIAEQRDVGQCRLHSVLDGLFRVDEVVTDGGLSDGIFLVFGAKHSAVVDAGCGEVE